MVHEELVQATLRELTRNLDLPDHIFNLKPIDEQLRYLKNEVMQTPADFELPSEVDPKSRTVFLMS